MPRIDDRILYSVFYLYPTVDAANANEKSGGTGFRVSVASKVSVYHKYVYAVSNRHVVLDPPVSSPVIRSSIALRIDNTTRRAGTREVIDLKTHQWTPHPDPTVDLAIAPLGRFFDMPTVPNLPYSIPSSLFLTHDVIQTFDIGPGDDVYMVGRFVHHEGTYLNQPSVRSGIISLMPDMIDMGDGGPLEEGFLIEMRSVSGFSGSPVVWTPPTKEALMSLHRQRALEGKDTVAGPWLIGIDCVRFNQWEPVYKEIKEHGKTRHKDTNFKAKSHAGQSMVIPAWKLQELMNLEEFNMARKRDDEKLAEELRANRTERTRVTPPAEDSELTEQGFNDVLRKVSQKIPESQSSDSGK